MIAWTRYYMWYRLEITQRKTLPFGLSTDLETQSSSVKASTPTI